MPTHQTAEHAPNRILACSVPGAEREAMWAHQGGIIVGKPGRAAVLTPHPPKSLTQWTPSSMKVHTTIDLPGLSRHDGIFVTNPKLQESLWHALKSKAKQKYHFKHIYSGRFHRTASVNKAERRLQPFAFHCLPPAACHPPCRSSAMLSCRSTISLWMQLAH